MATNPSTRLKVYSLTGGHCIYCAAKITVDGMSMDHALPRSKGGFATISNLLPSCHPCNSRKGASADILANMKDFTFLKVAVRFAKVVEARIKLLEARNEIKSQHVEKVDGVQETAFASLKSQLRKRCQFYNNTWQVRDMCERALNEISAEEKFDMNSVERAWPAAAPFKVVDMSRI